MNRFKSLTAGLVLALGMTGLTLGSAQAAPITVTNLDDFNTAIGTTPVTSDSFSNDIAGGVEITFDSGVVSTLSGGDLSLAIVFNRVISSRFSGSLDGDGSFAPLTLTWTFPVPVVGFIADFDFIDFLDVTIPGSDVFFDIRTVMGGESGTFGLVDSQTPFSQIQFSIQNSE